MSTDRLREAARVLRERAQAAPQGQWFIEDGMLWVAHDQERSSSSGLVDALPVWALGATPYIATVHPLVGLALADLLDHLADDERDGYSCGDATSRALDIADLILGGER